METLNLPKAELEKFANDVLERFNNPFVDHQVTSIMLNSFPKFQTRDLPGLKEYLKRKGKTSGRTRPGTGSHLNLLQRWQPDRRNCNRSE